MANGINDKMCELCNLFLKLCNTLASIDELLAELESQCYSN